MRVGVLAGGSYETLSSFHKAAKPARFIFKILYFKGKQNNLKINLNITFY